VLVSHSLNALLTDQSDHSGRPPSLSAFPTGGPLEFEADQGVWLPSGIDETMENAMHHWSFGAVIAFVTGLVVAFVLIFMSIRSRKKAEV
jgi:hypothetical protein